MNLPAALRRRRTHAGPGQRPAAPADRLVSTAQRRLAITTLALLVALLVVVGATTALLGQRSLDASVDRTLETAAVAELSRLHEATGPTGSAAPGESGGGGEQESEQTPAASHTAPGTQTAATLATDADDHAPAAADTFFLYLDASGAVVANPERVALAGLPDRDAAVAASLRGRDLRTVRVGDVRLRLLSLAVPAEDGAGANIRTLQAGFVLTLHDEQSDTLLRSILVVGLGGLLGAAFVSVVLTRRALVPVRAAFERERRFVAAASHELRTPIALIRGSAEVLGREGNIRPPGRLLVADIVAEADRLGGLVAELSELAVAQARPPKVLLPVDLGVLASDVARRARPMAEAQGLSLEAADAAGEPVGRPPVIVRGDHDRIVQVALILIDNAIRHSPQGGAVRITTADVRGWGELSVTDEGPGIPASERERIFEPFAQLTSRRIGHARTVAAPAGGPRVAVSHGGPQVVAARASGGPTGAAPAAVGGGTGLGLAIARSILAGMNGDIRVADAVDRGSIFTISLPIV